MTQELLIPKSYEIQLYSDDTEDLNLQSEELGHGDSTNMQCPGCRAEADGWASKRSSVPALGRPRQLIKVVGCEIRDSKYANPDGNSDTPRVISGTLNCCLIHALLSRVCK